MAAPRIGIPLSLDTERRLRRAGDALYVSAALPAALARAGARVLHLPPQPDVPALLDGIDAVLLPGGDDFLPDRSYPDAVRFAPAPAAQLEFDRRLLREALTRELPVLGICYGMQLLALELGGTLCYDIATELPNAQCHALGSEKRHPLRWCPEPSRLRGALPTLDRVNSRHHQSVADPGPHLRVVARAPDGVVEAIEQSGDAFRVGIQWHPEDDPDSFPLFDAFVRVAADRGPPSA